MSYIDRPRRSKRISENSVHITNQHVTTTIQKTHYVEVYIDDIGREAISSAVYRYMCHGCGSPEELIVGTLNKGNRLALWCATCYLVPHDESTLSENNFLFSTDTSDTIHLPRPVAKGVHGFVLDWPFETNTRDGDTTRKLRLLSKGRHNWLLCDMSRHRCSERLPGCEGSCSGCQSVQNNLKIWLPEVTGWYDRFDYNEGDGDWWVRKGKAAATKKRQNEAQTGGGGGGHCHQAATDSSVTNG